MNRSLRVFFPAGILAAVCIFAGAVLATHISFGVTKENQPGYEQLLNLAKQDTLSPLFAEVARAVRPSVVEVRVTKKVSMDQMPDVQFFERFFGNDHQNRLPQNPGSQRRFIQRGLGSGVIVDASNGYVLTNYHVVDSADATTIVLSDGRSFKSEWIRVDPQSDLAIVKIRPEGLTAATLGDSADVKVGNWVLAFGAPEGLAQTVTAGIISGTGRSTGEANVYQDFLQTDAAINVGNSGGPLVNMKGEVIGITTAIVSQSGGSEGIGLAISSDMAKNVMYQLIDKGKVTRGYLGVSIQNVNESLAKSFNLPDTLGALITSVAPGSPASKAGLNEGDFMRSISGTMVRNVNELRNAIAGAEPGKTVSVEFYRDGKKTEAKVAIETQPALTAEAAKPAPEETTGGKLGLEVATMTRELSQEYGYETQPTGVVITLVTPGFPADAQGLKEGMVITQVQGRAVASADQFSSAVFAKGAASGVRLRVIDRIGGAMFIVISPEK
jgi:serine protease Do